MPSERRRKLRRNVTLVGNFVLLLLFFGLDIRDLYFKIAWLGPYDSYGFTAVGIMRIGTPLLIPAQSPANFHRGNWSRDSGWSSFLARCDVLQGSGFFLEVVGKNCSVGDPSNPEVVQSLLMSSAVRVDSIAWGSCKLLHYHRRPPICQERMVTGFLKRYRFEEHRVPRRAIARVDSPAERELLQLLEVIGHSAPSFRVVCVQSFVFEGAGVYKPTIYGCSSPSVFESAFAGHKVTFLRELLQDKAWLTADVLDIMGIRFTIRQNDKSVFMMDAIRDGEVMGEHRTIINFSASGQLYALVIVIDVMLATIHVLGALEIISGILIPSFRTQTTNLADHLGGGDHSCFSMFSRSLYRNRPVVLLTTITHMISWQIILPNAVVWTWSSSRKGKLISYMSSIRVWVLLLISFNALWDVVVLLGEKWAFAFASRTFLSTVELMAIGAAVAFVNRADLFSMGEKKYAVEHQRLVDVSSFSNGVGFANAYDDDNNGCGMGHGRAATSVSVLGIVYGPLFRILMRSITSIFVFLVIKMAYLRWQHRRKQRKIVASVSAAVGPIGDQVHRSGLWIESNSRKPYAQVAVEELMGTPIRARSLIRSAFAMETEINGIKYVVAPLFFDFGVLLDDEAGVVRSRVGFYGGVIPRSIDLSTLSQSATMAPMLTRGPDTEKLPQLSFISDPLTHRSGFEVVRASPVPG